MISERQYIKDAIYDWVTAVVAETGRSDPVIHRINKGTRPLPPFIMLEFTGESIPGAPYYSRVQTDGTSDGEQYLSQFVRKSMTMYAFGEGSFDLLETIRASIYLARYIDLLRSKALAIPQALDVSENPTARDTGYEESALFDFFVTFIRVITDTPGWIKTVQTTSDNPAIGEITNREEEAHG
jgi:hypothetical protein